MRVNIGPYTSDLIPIYRMERAYERMRARQIGIADWDFDEEHYRWYDRIINKAFRVLHSTFRLINRWSNNRNRKIDVRIDDYDVWSADHTLALIILPVLKKLRDKNSGSPHIEVEDVPENLRPTEEPNDENGYVDNTHHDRWLWVLDEMIWAFEQHAMGSDVWEDQFIHNYEQLEIKWVEIEDEEYKGCSQIDVNHQKDPSKPAYFQDDEGIKAHRERMANGRRLFAKYYDRLWD